MSIAEKEVQEAFSGPDYGASESEGPTLGDAESPSQLSPISNRPPQSRTRPGGRSMDKEPKTIHFWSTLPRATPKTP
jgi:hypothetical protein